jgi:dihydropyrimidinase
MSPVRGVAGSMGEEEMLDLVISGERVVTPSGVAAVDVAIQGETIAAVATRGTFGPGSAHRHIDAGSRIVMPGGIDPHVHCLWFVPNPDGSAGLSDPPSTVSRAALYGGTTTIIDFVRWTHGNTIAQAIDRRQQDWVGQCHCDYSLHVMVEGQLPPDIPEQLAQAIRNGYPTIKLFTTDITPSRRGRMVDFGDIWEVFQVTAREGGLCVVHGEDNDIVMHMYEKLGREGRTHFQYLSEVHNTLSEDLSFRRVIRLAESVPGRAPIYFMHVSAATGVQAIREARERGSPVYGETLHQYLMYTDADYQRPGGQMFHTYPSLKSETDRQALWAGAEDGTLQTVATDELCCTLATKLQGSRIDDTTGGNAGVEPRLAVMYTEMVGRRGWSLEKFVDLTSTHAAKLMGLYPRKGAIAPGSDADIAVLDPGLARTVRKEQLHETDYTPWEGHEVHAWPCMTVLRGKVVVEGGRFTGELSDGRFLPRRIDPAILAGGDV